MREEEERDMMKTLQLLQIATTHLEQEEKIQQQEEADMSKTLELLSEALTQGEKVFLSGQRQGRFVHFSPNIKILHLPADERVEARQARKKYWEAGPLHDELWDGDSGTFREVELTPEELVALLRRTSKTLITGKIKGFFFNRVKNIDAKSHATRMAAEEDDGEEVVDQQQQKQPVSGGIMDKRRSSSRLLSFIRRRSTKTPSSTANASQLQGGENENIQSQDWLTRVWEESDKLNDLGEEVEEQGADSDDDGKDAKRGEQLGATDERNAVS